jgi:site-specific recombinase XerD
VKVLRTVATGGVGKRAFWYRAPHRPTGLQSWLFPGPRVSEPITRSGVEWICQKAGQTAQINKAVYPHLMRHYLPFLTMSCSTLMSPSFPGKNAH